MKILLIGATGMIGSRIMDEALARGHDVVAAVRNPDKVGTNGKVTAVKVDVNNAGDIAPLADKADLIISAVSPRSTGDAPREAVTFTEALIEVARSTGKRLLMVGGASTLHLPDGTSVMEVTPPEIVPEATGMRLAYGMMVQADIDFAVLSPGGMIAPGERTGKFRLGGRTILTGPDGDKGNISAEDYAIAMLDEAEKPAHFRTVFNVAY